MLYMFMCIYGYLYLCWYVLHMPGYVYIIICIYIYKAGVGTLAIILAQHTVVNHPRLKWGKYTRQKDVHDSLVMKWLHRTKLLDVQLQVVLQVSRLWWLWWLWTDSTRTSLDMTADKPSASAWAPRATNETKPLGDLCSCKSIHIHLIRTSGNM